MILPVGNAQLFVDQIFRIFDKDGNGTIDFKVSFLLPSRVLRNFMFSMRNSCHLFYAPPHHFGVDAIYLVMFSGLVTKYTYIVKRLFYCPNIHWHDMNSFYYSQKVVILDVATRKCLPQAIFIAWPWDITKCRRNEWFLALNFLCCLWHWNTLSWIFLTSHFLFGCPMSI